VEALWVHKMCFCVNLSCEEANSLINLALSSERFGSVLAFFDWVFGCLQQFFWPFFTEGLAFCETINLTTLFWRVYQEWYPDWQYGWQIYRHKANSEKQEQLIGIYSVCMSLTKSNRSICSGLLRWSCFTLWVSEPAVQLFFKFYKSMGDSAILCKTGAWLSCSWIPIRYPIVCQSGCHWGCI